MFKKFAQGAVNYIMSKNIYIDNDHFDNESSCLTEGQLGFLANEGFLYKDILKGHVFTSTVRDTYIVKFYVSDLNQMDLMIFVKDDFSNILFTKTLLFDSESFVKAYAIMIEEMEGFFNVDKEDEEE